MHPQLELTQVLLLTEPENLERTGPALWAMFEEVVAVFNVGEERVRPVRRCVTPLPIPGLQGIATEEEQIVGSEIVPTLKGPGRWAGTLDPGPLADRVRGLLEAFGHTPDALLVVTDQEITPPREWRYILWDGEGDWAVVSTAPMDPVYWGLLDEDPTVQVKRRARAASICEIGSMLGLERCENPRCFMYGNVDSVLRLDRMWLIGDEHPDFPDAGMVGFGTDEQADPGTPEPLADPAELGYKARWR